MCDFGTTICLWILIWHGSCVSEVCHKDYARSGNYDKAIVSSPETEGHPHHQDGTYHWDELFSTVPTRLVFDFLRKWKRDSGQVGEVGGGPTIAGQAAKCISSTIALGRSRLKGCKRRYSFFPSGKHNELENHHAMQMGKFRMQMASIANC